MVSALAEEIKNKHNKMNLNNFIISIIEDIPKCKNVIEFLQ